MSPFKVVVPRPVGRGTSASEVNQIRSRCPARIVMVGETIQEPLQDLLCALAESLPGPGPDRWRTARIWIAALQGQPGDNPDCSDRRNMER